MREVVVDLDSVRDPDELLSPFAPAEAGEGGDQSVEWSAGSFACHGEGCERVAGVVLVAVESEVTTFMFAL